MIKEYFIPCIVGHLLGTPIAVLPTLPICLSDGMCNNRQINARVVLKLGSSSHCLHRFRADDFIPSRNLPEGNLRTDRDGQLPGSGRVKI